LECEGCETLGLLTYNDSECVICKETVHPIVFRCETCVESPVCVTCESKRDNPGSCPICSLQGSTSVPVQHVCRTTVRQRQYRDFLLE
jgi:hypothetical protein